MALPKPPLLLGIGTVENFAALGAFGTPTINGGVADPFGGTGTYRIEDNDAAATEGVTKPWVTGMREAVVLLAPETATTSSVRVRDSSGAAVLWCTIDWATRSVSIVSGSGEVAVVEVAVAGGLPWLLLWLRIPAVPAFTPEFIDFFPAYPNAATGGAYFYGRCVVAPGWLDKAVAWEDEAEGGERALSPDGSWNTWASPADGRLRADVRWIPRVTHTAPVFATGWEGLSGDPSLIEPGWETLLAAVRRLGLPVDVALYNDKTTALVSCTLLEPVTGPPEQEDDGTRRIRLVLSSRSARFNGAIG